MDPWTGVIKIKSDELDIRPVRSFVLGITLLQQIIVYFASYNKIY